MRLQDLNWKDVESYLKHDNRIILITGATEQHAYLSLLTDILIPSRIALAVAERENVLVAPPLNFGLSGMFGEFPGTISLSQETFDAALGEIVESLLHQGFSNFFIMNGHGGNKLPAHLHDLHMEGTIRLVWYEWWREPAATAFASELGMEIDHANWGENFPFTRVGDLPPDLVDAEKPHVNLELSEEGGSLRDVIGDGNFGGRYQISDDYMTALYLRVVDEAAALLHSMKTPTP